MTYFTLTFANQAEAEEHLSVLSYRRLPVSFQDTRAAHNYDDDGRKIISVARRNFASVPGAVVYSFAEQPVH